MLTFINTSFWLIVCFGMAWLVRFFPREWYEKSWVFKSYTFEKRMYKTIGVSRWKDKLPEWGRLVNFEKKNLDKELSLKYVDKFILETYYAEAGHFGMAIVGFACILINPADQMTMALTCSIVNFCVQIPFCLIQRYNRPRLELLRKRLERKNGRLPEGRTLRAL
ncbi:MAG: hypothetical protein ACQEUT_00645 [Bacillota bacterium]